MLTAQTKTMERDWHWTSSSAIFGFTFSNQVLTPDIYGAHWYRTRVDDDSCLVAEISSIKFFLVGSERILFYFLSMRMKQSDWLIRLSQRAVFLHPARCEMQPARCEIDRTSGKFLNISVSYIIVVIVQRMDKK